MDGHPVNTDRFDELKAVLGDALQIRDRAAGFDAATPLFGSLAELDSMSVLTLIGAIEDRFDITFEDDEITAEAFATLGALHELVMRKLAP